MELTEDKKKRAALIVDNDPTCAERLKDLLCEIDYAAYIVRNIDEAKTIAEQKQVVVVFLALGRPDLDPGRIIKGLKRENDDGRIPIIVI